MDIATLQGTCEALQAALGERTRRLPPEVDPRRALPYLEQARDALAELRARPDAASPWGILRLAELNEGLGALRSLLGVG